MAQNKKYSVKDNTITFTTPITTNGTEYKEITMRYPSYSELMAHYDVIEKAGTKEAQVALAELAKLCAESVKKKSDFDAMPSFVMFAVSTWVGEHIA